MSDGVFCPSCLAAARRTMTPLADSVTQLARRRPKRVATGDCSSFIFHSVALMRQLCCHVLPFNAIRRFSEGKCFRKRVTRPHASTDGRRANLAVHKSGPNLTVAPFSRARHARRIPQRAPRRAAHLPLPLPPLLSCRGRHSTLAHASQEGRSP